MLNDLPEKFEFIHQASTSLQKDFQQNTMQIEIPANTPICHQGNRCEHLPIVLEGQARVFKLSETGREITLYRINANESCILTASCIMSDITFPATAETEMDVKAILIPQKYVHSWFDTHSEWRHFIFEMISRRLSDVLTVIDEIAFQRMDKRLANHLIQKEDNGIINTTHQAIAYELGTAREVVSRLLHDMEMKGHIEIQRGKIRIINKAALI